MPSLPLVPLPPSTTPSFIVQRLPMDYGVFTRLANRFQQEVELFIVETLIDMFYANIPFDYAYSCATQHYPKEFTHYVDCHILRLIQEVENLQDMPELYTQLSQDLINISATDNEHLIPQLFKDLHMDSLHAIAPHLLELLEQYRNTGRGFEVNNVVPYPGRDWFVVVLNHVPENLLRLRYQAGPDNKIPIGVIQHEAPLNATRR